MKFLKIIILFLILHSCKNDKKVERDIKIEAKTETIQQNEVAKTPHKDLYSIEISLKNIKSRDSVAIDTLSFFTRKTILNTTFRDSIQSDKIIILNKKPENKVIKYNVSKDEIINLNINTTLETYDYFLKANDKLEIEFDNDGFISKSSINGKTNDPSLIFSKNKIPSKKIEYLKLVKKHNLRRFNDRYFEKNFEKRFQKSMKSVAETLQKAKDSLDSNLYASLENHLKFINIQNEYAKGNPVKIPLSDEYMNLASYRKLQNYMMGDRYSFEFFDMGKEGVNKVFELVEQLNKDDFLKGKTKTKYLIIRKLLDDAGYYEPNLIPEIIAKIKDEQIRKKYLKLYTDEYLLALKEKRDDNLHLNIININQPKKITTFDEFLNKNKGKVIYVDLWASWCAPCRNQMRFSHELNKKLMGKPIVFAYFSVDNSFVKWKIANIEEDLETYPNSYLVLNSKKSEKFIQWNVRGIPRALIYDKNGVLVNKNAPLPKDKNLVKELTKYINQ